MELLKLVRYRFLCRKSSERQDGKNQSLQKMHFEEDAEPCSSKKCEVKLISKAQSQIASMTKLYLSSESQALSKHTPLNWRFGI
jgi:hypothetical protein